MASHKVEITAEFRSETESAWAVHVGWYEEDKYGRQREVWCWLPKSQCRRDEDDENIWHVPEWMALEKGLI